MNRSRNLLLMILLAVSSCKEQAEFYDTLEIVEELIERMEQENTGFGMQIFVEPISKDSVHVRAYLINNKNTLDTLSSNSTFPSYIAYSYGEEITDFENQLIVQDQKIYIMPARGSILVRDFKAKRIVTDDHNIRGVFRYSVPPENTATDYWLVSNPVLVKKYSN